MSIQIGQLSPGPNAVEDGFIDLRPCRPLGTTHVNPDGKSGRFTVWGRSGSGWDSRTGHRYTGTWRCG